MELHLASCLRGDLASWRLKVDAGLELESQSHDGSALVHVVHKIILVVVHIQHAVAGYQSNVRR